MERIVYNKTLDTHKSGVQFTLQGFETADKMSRRIVISLMASGDSIDLPLEQMEAVMYVKTPGIAETSINSCTIEGNTIIYDALPITEEGITTMQLKLIDSRLDGANGVLAAPKFAVEVVKSDAEDESIKGTASYTAVEEALARAREVHDKMLLRIALHSDCMFYAYYADGTIYESDVLKELFLKGDVLLSQSYAKGGTGIRDGEETDNSKYYSNVSKSMSLETKKAGEDALAILDEVKKHGVYTVFDANFETGELVYESPKYEFEIDKESGELNIIGKAYNIEETMVYVITEWLRNEHGVTFPEFKDKVDELCTMTMPIERGGTGATTKEDAILNLGIDKYRKPWNVDENVGRITCINANLEVSTLSGKPIETTFDIFMKNSGHVFLCFTYGLTKYNTDDYANNNLIEVYVNDTLNKSITNIYSGVSTQERILLDVKHGDIVKIRVKTSKDGIDGNMWRTLGVSDIHLRANIETPYIYYSIENTIPEN